MTTIPESQLATSLDNLQAQINANAEASTNHFEEFEVGKYRGIEELSIKNIAPINLIVGKNASGKTSLLEAIWLFYNRRNPRTLWDLDLSRSAYDYTDPIAELGRDGEISMSGIQGGSRHSYLATFQTLHAVNHARKRKALNPNPNLNKPQVVGSLHVNLDGDEKRSRSADKVRTRKGLVLLPKLSQLKTSSPLLLHNSFLRRDFHSLSEIIKRGNKELLIKQLRLVQPLLKDVDIIMEDDGEPYILGTTEAGERLKLEDMGGGMVQLFDCLVALYTSRNSILCIDEIESGLHYNLLPEFWNSIKILSKELNVQIFAATHSSECINAAIETYKDRPTDIRIYTLYYNNNERRIKSVSYSGDELAAINNMNVEIR